MKKNGFTLIELLVTIAILGILVGVAYPSYVSYVQDSRRSEAQAKLIDLANRQEMYYLDHHKYASGLNALLGDGPDKLLTENKYYEIETSSSKATVDFTLTATPKNQQAGDTDCAFLAINHELTKTATNANGTNCWN
ncbi:type IV pilin protein [Psychromonas aquimarina]|uniref:type IV pilin protein n=1 Tax=Psychromonas aquimarina TaxID=444919 RepID=UPI0003FD86F4|nr:type IV pilin protein [Psychromonas aquimarina]